MAHTLNLPLGLNRVLFRFAQLYQSGDVSEFVSQFEGDKKGAYHVSEVFDIQSQLRPTPISNLSACMGPMLSFTRRLVFTFLFSSLTSTGLAEGKPGVEVLAAASLAARTWAELLS